MDPNEELPKVTDEEPTEFPVVRGGVEKEWYDVGFKFAVNYINAWMSKDATLDDTGKPREFNRANFQELVKAVIDQNIIEDDFFDDLTFFVDENGYGGRCPDPDHPGDPNFCIDCTGSDMPGVPKPESTE